MQQSFFVIAADHRTQAHTHSNQRLLHTRQHQKQQQQQTNTKMQIISTVFGCAVALLAAGSCASAAVVGTSGAARRLVKRDAESVAASTSASLATKPKTKKAKSFEKQCLAAHNEWRKLHQAPPLTIDSKITKFAQKRADFIAASDGAEFKHPADLEFGENLAWHSRDTTSCKDLVKMWYDEELLYDYVQAAFSHETGHFTQLVWKSTQRVGCARAISSGKKGGVYLVCNYDPAGNYLGEGVDNVARPSASGARAITAPPTSPPTTTTTTLRPTTTTTLRPTTTTTLRPTTTTTLRPTTTTTTTLRPTTTTTTRATTTSLATTTTSPPSSSTTAKPIKKKKKNKKNKNKKKQGEDKKKNVNNKPKRKSRKNKNKTTTVKPTTTTTPTITTTLSI